jgi:urease accessory protein
MSFMPARHILAPQPQRATGRLDLAFEADGNQTRVKTFYQEGCLKTRLPRPQNPNIAEAVSVNISGGIAGGDSLTTAMTVGPNARLSFATQSAERIYRALHAAPARLSARITLAEGAQLDYLPQETILFDGFALNRTLDIDLAPDADFLGVESLVFGRQAMGERITEGSLRDRITLRQDGKLLFQDMTKLDGDIAATLARKAVANGAVATAALIYAGPDTAKILPKLRDALAPFQAGASCPSKNIIFARILAPSAISLRNCLCAAFTICRAGAKMPRVWQG